MSMIFSSARHHWKWSCCSWRSEIMFWWHYYAEDSKHITWTNRHWNWNWSKRPIRKP